MVHTASAVAAALVAVAFGCSTFERWLARRRRQELVWSIALALFALAALALAAGAALGWTALTFRLFYALGVANVPVLALGTVYLLAGERRGDQVAVVVGLAVAFGAGVVLASPLTGPLPRDELVRGSEVFGAGPRIFAAIGSAGGAAVIFVGALVSAVRFRRGRMLWANVLIAAGTAVLSASGLLNSVLDEMTGFSVTLVAGISVIFAGFLVAAGGRTTPAGPAGGRATPGAPAEAASRPSRAVVPGGT